MTGALVERSTPLVGGTSSAVVKHVLTDGRTVVTRHITNTEWLRREPHLVDAEAAALCLLAASKVRAPSLIATDVTSGRLAMTFLDGEMIVTARGLRQRATPMPNLATADGISLCSLDSTAPTPSSICISPDPTTAHTTRSGTLPR